MVDIGDAETTLMLAESAELEVGPDDFILMRAVRFEKSHPEQRINHGRTRTYSHAAPDLAITFTLSASSDVYTNLKTWSTRNASGVLPSNTWRIRATSVNGTAVVLSMNGKLIDWNSAKGLNDQENPIDIEARIRITDETVNIT